MKADHRFALHSPIVNVGAQMAEPIKAGAVIEVAHPFVRDIYNGYDCDGPYKARTWRPGTRHEPVPPDDWEAVADAIGTQILTVVGTYKPGRYPERIFYTRQWRDPNGHLFGKAGLHTKTAQAFRTIIRGYRHEFRLLDAPSALLSTQREADNG